MRAITLFIVLSICFSAQLYGQDSSNQTVSSQKIEVSSIGKGEDKASLRQLLAQFTSFKATFKQSIIDLQGQELQNSVGELLLKKPQQLRWTITAPDESLLLADGETVYNVDPFVEQVTLLDQSTLTKSNPLMLLITEQESQWAQVNVVKRKNTFVIVSLLADSPIVRLELTFDENQKLASILSIDRQQQQNRLLFSNVKYDNSTKASDFEFIASDGWLIDDQRVKTVQ